MSDGRGIVASIVVVVVALAIVGCGESGSSDGNQANVNSISAQVKRELPGARFLNRAQGGDARLLGLAGKGRDQIGFELIFDEPVKDGKANIGPNYFVSGAGVDQQTCNHSGNRFVPQYRGLLGKVGYVVYIPCNQAAGIERDSGAIRTLERKLDAAIFAATPRPISCDGCDLRAAHES